MRRLDDLDNRIVKEAGSPQIVQWNVRESYASVAKRVGADEETVRKRIRRMEREGSIMGWRVMVNPSLIGRSYVAVDATVRDADKKADAISRLKKLEGMAAFMNFEGGGLLIFLYSEPGHAVALKARQIAEMCGEAPTTVEPLGIPPCELKLSNTDWRIVWAIRNDPRKSLSEIAKEAHVSSRTVNRRLTALTENGAFFLVGIPNLRQSPGVSVNLLISCREGHSSTSIADKITGRFGNVVFGGPFSSHLVSYNFVFNNLIEAGEAHEWVKAVEGVAEARLGFMKVMVFVPDWLDGQIAERA